MQRSDLTLFTALGALALFVGGQSYQAMSTHPHRTAAVSSGSVSSTPARETRGLRPRDGRAMTAELPVEIRGMDRGDVRRRLQESEQGTYIGELLLDRDSALTRWPDRVARPLRVWIATGTALGGWDDAFREQVDSAFAQWTTVGIPVRFTMVRDSASADVHVLWTDRFAEPISGKTIWSRDDQWWIVDADITIALHHQDGEPLDAPQVRAIALHEIGHLLGLDHTADAANIMAAKVRVRELSAADQATARLLYSVPAGKVR